MRQELRIDRILADMPHLIDGMIEGAERTRDIVDALKRFSAVDKMTPEQVNLNEVVERSVRWVVQSASAKLAMSRSICRPTCAVRARPASCSRWS
jgi:two-component system sensor histidine kinase HupT/HoxJ